MSIFKEKMVAVMNKGTNPVAIMNALAHMAIGLGGKVGKERLSLVDYKDADGNTYPNISKIPFIILRATSNKILNLYRSAKAEQIDCTVFTDTMIHGGWEEQLKNTEKTATENLTFHGIVLVGDWGKISQLTKKFSLWR